jgi:uncharacterized protein (DUF433 family)
LEAQVAKNHVETKPNVCGGRPCIVGTRIRVQDIYVCHELKGMTTDEILGAYPSISLADIHAALAYYHDHRDEINRQMQEEREFVEALKARTGPGPLEALTTASDASLPSR